jgi:thioredoxin 1
MKIKNLKLTFLSFILIIPLLSTACGQNSTLGNKQADTKKSVANNQTINESFKVTFIELGSVNCIPCRQMQPIMKSIEAKYGKEVKVDFHDVWTEAGKPFGVKYGIEAIPTQVFLDQTGKEYYRHVGYFPEAELVKILKIQGVKID